ncbi:hypothetical protein D5R81_15430 [Parashewanella spongiae]|uniref:Toprim domain-containing protein n=1 Tax=Parashewanella spongiae TaxID=342950 RepID=A0A3A6TG99_9GAMM|nr:LPD7 domain-containing protein [Parashewanella spongiae]MCL1079441.1 DUF5710 domain-containing protein [Parashewanella spongiae]RJY07554.1 hypothetical protein D5R81_15430 [Parashewanella spongiae]
MTTQKNQSYQLETERFYLAVPYAEREQAKKVAGILQNGKSAIGFDSDRNLWFAKQGANLTRLQDWLPKPEKFDNLTSTDPVNEFAMQMQSAGLLLNELPLMDGKVHRVKTQDDKGSQKSGAYAGYNDGHPAGWYQDHRNHSEPKKWIASFKQSDPFAKLQIKAQLANREYQRQQAQSKKHQHHAKRCSQVFQLLPIANADHPYLKRKLAKVFPDVCQDKQGRLVIPLMDENHRVHSLQRIYANGFKSLKKGAAKTGHFFVVGYKPLTNGEPILYAEGYATAASIVEATGRSVVMTVDAGNMPKVAAKLKATYPQSGHLFLADDDYKNAVNKGVEKAKQAANLTQGFWLMPRFIRDQIEHGMTDFNDLFMSSGKSTVEMQIEDHIKKCWPYLIQKRPEQLLPELNSIAPAEPDKFRSEKTVTPNNIKPVLEHYHQVENRYYFNRPPKQLAFIDKGNKLQSRLVNSKVITDLLTLANDRGWQQIKLSGCKAFKREVWYQAKLQGFDVKGYRADDKDKIRLQQAQPQQRVVVNSTINLNQSPNQNANQQTALESARTFSQVMQPASQQQFMAKVQQKLKVIFGKNTTITEQHKGHSSKEVEHEHQFER